MFISYQFVRNTILLAVSVIIVGLYYVIPRTTVAPPSITAVGPNESKVISDAAVATETASSKPLDSPPPSVPVIESKTSPSKLYSSSPNKEPIKSDDLSSLFEVSKSKTSSTSTPKAELDDLSSLFEVSTSKTSFAKEPTLTNNPILTSPTTMDPKLVKYREAMRIANAPAVKGKGKDVLGPGSPWKLNLYDDDSDGRWDRGKLDTNRDDVDDEKWNFKKGRWEKDGGIQIWNGNDWTKEGPSP